MKLLYDEQDLKRILTKHHSYSNEPIKSDHRTLDVLSVKINSGAVIVEMGREEKQEPKSGNLSTGPGAP